VNTSVKTNRKQSIFAILAALVIGGIAAIVMLSSVSSVNETHSVQEEQRILNRRIFLSPSVQYMNAYACGDTNEGDEMQLLADACEALLREEDFDVLRSDADKTLEDAVTLSNRKNIGLHLALHTNASEHHTARGCEAFIKRGTDNELSDKIAALLTDEISDLGTPNRGVKQTDSLYETNHTKAESVVLLEVDFHDSEDGAKWLIENRDVIAEAIVQAILTFYGDETQ